MAFYLLTLLFFSALVTASACTNDIFAPHLPSNARVIQTYSSGPNSTFKVPQLDIGFPQSPTALPPFCGVEVNITTSATSSATFALWLPDQWNERYLAVGNAAFAGGINYLDIGVGIQYGFASMSTDTGHTATQIQTQWALNAHEARMDWGYRAMHMSAFYGCAHHHAYYSGCSTGGRQGFKEIELHPESFDGVLVGAPAWWLEHLQPASVAVALPNLPNSSVHNVPTTLFSVISAEVYRQCDGADGLKDGIIMNPIQCHLNLEPLLCTGPNPNTSACLSQPQLDTLRTFYATIQGPDNEFIWPGFAAGSENQWSFLLSGNAPSPLGTGWVQDFLLNDPNWNFASYTNDLVNLAEQPAVKVSTGQGTPADFDLSSYRSRGGKIFHYHGYSDALVVPQSSFILFDAVREAVAEADHERKGRKSRLDDWYRLFPIPGMQHCFTSPATVNAPWYIAGAQQAGYLTPPGQHSVPGYSNKDHDALLALVAWVEQGDVPEAIVATKYINDSVSQGVLRQRPICPVPKQAVYQGWGNADDASSWRCEGGFPELWTKEDTANIQLPSP